MKHLYTFGILAAALFQAAPAHAALVLTPAGIADGFGLSIFASGFTSITQEGPFGITMTSNGNVMVFNYPDSKRYVFSDVDGQTPASALFSPTVTNTGAQGYSLASGHPYGGDGAGHFVEFNDDGSINHILTGVSAQPYFGIATNFVNQHIIATSFSGLIDIDPLANGGLGSFRVITPTTGFDGVTVSLDGTTAYVADGSVVRAYSIATGTLVHTYTGFSFADGMGVINSNNNLNGQIIVNTNLGEIDLLNPVTGVFVAIATGGSRGDFASPDTTNGTLFLDYTDFVARLSCGSGCSIGSPAPVSGVPEVSSATLLLTGLAICGLVRIRKFSRP